MTVTKITRDLLDLTTRPVTSFNMNGGTIDGVTIGSTTSSTAAFTTLQTNAGVVSNAAFKNIGNSNPGDIVLNDNLSSLAYKSFLNGRTFKSAIRFTDPFDQTIILPKLPFADNGNYEVIHYTLDLRNYFSSTSLPSNATHVQFTSQMRLILGNSGSTAVVELYHDIQGNLNENQDSEDTVLYLNGYYKANGYGAENIYSTYTLPFSPSNPVYELSIWVYSALNINGQGVITRGHKVDGFWIKE